MTPVRSSRWLAARDAEILAAHARDVPWPTIAARHGLSRRRCQQIVREWQADGLDGGPFGVLVELAEQTNGADPALMEVA